MRVLQAFLCILALLSCAAVAHAEDAIEIGDWTVAIPAGFQKTTDSCDPSG